jgi:GTP-binding protein HflX
MGEYVIAVTSEKAVLVGVSSKDQPLSQVEDYLLELAFLIETAGAIPVKKFIQRLDTPNSRTYIGSGKLDEIKQFVKSHDIDIVIFDDELSPSQIRNIEKELEIRALDRTNLILDIFARRAKTAYAKTQVELAQYEYLLPRLAGMWTHLERQRGGIGLRGPGETEIETDRRIIRTKIALLKDQLKKIDKQMITQRKNRGKMVRVALVGYTNVGKSTLMNLLSKSDVFAENKLFATLDATVRKVVIGNLPFLLSDTVGFIRKLPHHLVESFKSTLDEVREADLLLHVVDISHSGFEEQIAVVNQTLQEIKAADKPVLVVFNKTDAYSYIKKDDDDLSPKQRENLTLGELKNSWMAKNNSPSIFISALKKQNIEELRTMLNQFLFNQVLGNLYSIGGCPFAQVIRNHPHIQCFWLCFITPQPSYKHLITVM